MIPDEFQTLFLIVTLIAVFIIAAVHERQQYRAATAPQPPGTMPDAPTFKAVWMVNGEGNPTVGMVVDQDYVFTPDSHYSVVATTVSFDDAQLYLDASVVYEDGKLRWATYDELYRAVNEARG